MRKNLIILLTLFVVLVSLASAQTDEQTIRKVLNDQVEAWNRGDVEGYMKGYWNSDSTVFNSGGALTKGYGNVLARYKKSYAQAKIHFDKVFCGTSNQPRVRFYLETI